MIKYAITHEWADVDGNYAKVGISEYAAKELGDIVYISLPQVGDEVVAGQSMCEVESVKAVSEILAPVSGKITAVNEELEDIPERINEAPMSAWIAQIEVTEVPQSLLSEEAYNAMEK